MIDTVRLAASYKITYLPHALKRMTENLTQIRQSEVQAVIAGGEVIEDYPEDVRGHSCLVAGYIEQGKMLHVVCSPKEYRLVVITVYVPSPAKWDETGKRRRLL